MLAAVFIFSGFVKGVDPWGTAIKLEEYFQAFGVDFLSGWSIGFSIALSGFEMFLGLILLFGIRLRITLPLMGVVMGAFTVVTLILAITDPISDCGCFGDAIKLTNWQTFSKNMALLAIALLLWIFGRRQVDKSLSEEKTIIEWSLGLLFMLSAIGVGIYSFRHLPIIDFLPFKIGVHIPTQMLGDTGESTTTLIYRDKISGVEREFSLDDTEWQDTLKWEFVDTRIVENVAGVKPTITEFSIFDSAGDHAQQLLASEQEVFIVTLSSTSMLESLSEKCVKNIESMVKYVAQHNHNAILVTTSPLPSDGKIKIGGVDLTSYNIDGTTLKTLIRANVGLVIIKEGTIIAKWNCRDIPDMNRFFK